VRKKILDPGNNTQDSILLLLQKYKKKELVPSAVRTIITIGVFNHNAFIAALTATLYLKLLYLLEDVLLQFYHLLFSESYEVKVISSPSFLAQKHRLFLNKVKQLYKPVAIYRG